MDISKLTHGAKFVLSASIAFLIVSFFSWFKVGDVGVASGWSGVGFLAGLLAIALIVWEGMRLADINLELGVSQSMITAALSVLLLIFALIRFISKPGGGLASSIVDRTLWAWLGLILAIVIVIGAWVKMRAAGESIGDMRTKFGEVAGSAAAAAKAATDKSSDQEAAAPAPAAPAAPAAEVVDEAVVEQADVAEMPPAEGEQPPQRPA